MTFGIQNKHSALNENFTYEREGNRTLDGLCDRVEIQPAIFRNVSTGRLIANKKIRFRLKPPTGRRFWTEWFPYARRSRRGCAR